MPFTFSHPAAAVAFTKYGWPLSALVVGSMAPDFPYFIHFSTRYQYGHTLPGLFYFCLPAGLAALWLFHNLLKLPLLSLFPANYQSRLIAASHFRFGPTRQFWLIVGALLLGAGTHLVWDSFTHADGWSVEHLAILRAPVLRTSRGVLYVFKILQHGSTLLGAALLLVWYRRWFKNSAAPPVELPIQISQPLKLRLIFFLLCFPVLLAALYSFVETTAAFEFQVFVRKLVVASVGIMMAELAIYSIIWQFKARR